MPKDAALSSPPEYLLAGRMIGHLLPLAALYVLLKTLLREVSLIHGSSGCCSEGSKGQSSMRKGLHGAGRMEIKVQGDPSAPQGDGQASKPPAVPVQQPAVVPPIAAFRNDSSHTQPEGGMIDVDIEEV